MSENNYLEKDESDKSQGRRQQNGDIEKAATGRKRTKTGLLYSVEETPPWYLCIVLGLQQYLTAFGAILTVPLILAPHFCLAEDHVGLSTLISTIFFVSGLCTLLQTTIGVRLPIVQGSTFAFLAPTIAVMTLPEWKCPYTDPAVNRTDLPEVGSDAHRTMWHARIAEIQGAIMVSSIFQIVVGFSGLMGFVLKFIGPLSIAPTIALMGLYLFSVAAGTSASMWWIALMTMFFIALFSQYLSNLDIPLPGYSRDRGIHIITRFPLLKLFPVLLAMCLSWLICYILTITNALPADPDAWGYKARTDSRSFVLANAPWFRFPYPGQWGVPTVSVAGVFGMLAGVLASMVESVGDYYACARLSGAPPPPDHAINRGIGMEGIGCILAGAWGSGNGTTSFSENIGAIGITRVGSRRVIQVGGVIMIVLGCLGKFGALFVTIPEPVIGGMFMVMFGMIAAVGFSNLQFVDMNSPRNLFIFGFSIIFGLALPDWMERNPGAIDVNPHGNDQASEIINQILTVLCKTSMFVGGFCGFILDNTIPGTDEERGKLKWRQVIQHDASSTSEIQNVDYSTYDIPLIQKYLDRMSWTKYIPFCPAFVGCNIGRGCCRAKKNENDTRNEIYKHSGSDGGIVNEAVITTEL